MDTSGAIFSDLKYAISEEEKITQCEKFGYEYRRAIKDDYTNAIVEYTIMEQKVSDYFEG